MPILTRWFIKAAFAWFLLALLGGVAQAARPEGPGLGPVVVHLFVVGWITQMIFGVAYWMFPKYSAESHRGHDRVAVATFVLLNAGLVLRAVAEPLLGGRPGAALGWLLVVSAAAQWLAGVGFVVNTWPRVKER